MTEKFTPSTETVFECFLDGAEGSFIREDLERYLAAVRAAALEEAADATYTHTTIGQDNKRTKSERPVLSSDVREWLRERAAAIRAAKEQS